MKEKGEGVNEYCRRRYLEAETDEDVERIEHELVEEGVNEGTARSVKSELKAKGRIPKKRSMLSLQRAFPDKLGKNELITPEAVLDALKLQDGDYKLGFKDGVLMLLLATRLTQELAATQAAQMRPMIDMLTAMRQEEKEAAERARGSSMDIAREAAVEAASGVAEAISPAFEGLRTSIQSLSPNPMASMLTRAMEPFFQQAMASLMQLMTRRQGQSAQPQQPGAQSPPVSNHGMRQLTENEMKEAFND
jgi:hypothetical protein